MKRTGIVCLRIATGGFFVVTGVLKLVAFETFLFSIADFQMLQPRMISAVAIAVTSLEVGFGAALAVGLYTRQASATLGVLTFCFLAVMSVALARGTIVDCGCFGSTARAQVGFGPLARNVFIVMSCFLLWRIPCHHFSIDSLLITDPHL
jgi:uncharacterized membrane protein YphA (DoxX/SURF4 family)